MSATTGKALSGEDHLRQSVADILSTPLGSRVLRRDYGSLVPELIDAPANRSTAVRLYGAVAGALRRWEPRLRLSSVRLVRGDRAGAYRILLAGARTDTPRPTPVSIALPLSGAPNLA